MARAAERQAQAPVGLDPALVEAAARAWLAGSVHAEGRPGTGLETHAYFRPKSADELLRAVGVTFDGARRLYIDYERAIRRRAYEIEQAPELTTTVGGCEP
jgi:hypothetical protein